jgi:hypothetical protein
MQYMILNYSRPEEIAAAARGLDPADPLMAPWIAYTRALAEAGVLRGGNALAAQAMTTTLRVRGGVREVQDGPYADTKDHLGGYYIIEVPDLDAALHWAALNPAAESGAVEVRPVTTP